MTEPKRHHYVPRTYSQAFTDTNGLLHLFDKWTGRSFAPSPRDALVVGQLYRQPVHAESRFDAALENFFAQEVDGEWELIRHLIKTRANLDQNVWGKFVQYIVSQFARTPLSLNSTIELLRDYVATTSDRFAPLDPSLTELGERFGVLDASFSDLVDAEIVNIRVDPHRALISMPLLIRSIPLFKTGFAFGMPGFLHNQTALDFIFSDNPIVFFEDSRVWERSTPYRVRSDQNFIFIFPISPRIDMMNSSSNKNIMMHRDLNNSSEISAINRIVAKYSYRFVASNSSYLSIKYGEKFANVCPRPDFRKSKVLPEGYVEEISYKFGEPRPLNNEWTYDFEGQR
jgi:hypothetical protein